MASGRITPIGFSLRCLVALVLVLLTYNPTETLSYYHWAQTGEFLTPEKVLAGLILLVGYIVLFRATMRSIGVAGAVLIAAVLAALIWLLVRWGVLTMDATVLEWVVLIAIGLVLGIGVSWSLVRRRITGQVDVDDIEE